MFDIHCRAGDESLRIKFDTLDLNVISIVDVVIKRLTKAPST
jgi:hypothetical protein